MKKLFFRELGQWVELDDEVADALDGDRAKVRMTEQNNGRCRIPKKKIYLCDGNCLDCFYHRDGRKVVEKRACESCPYGVPKAKRGHAKLCGDCENYEFLGNASIYGSSANIEDSPFNVDAIIGTAPSPEELILQEEAIDEYKRMAKSVPGGHELIDQLSSGDTVSEVARDTGTPQSTVNSRKDKIKKAIEANGVNNKNA